MFAKKLKREFPYHEVKTVPEMGWQGKKNGELLALMQADFDVFVTIDNNMPYQQELENRDIAYVFLSAKSNRLEDLKPLMPEVLEKLETLQAGNILIVGKD